MQINKFLVALYLCCTLLLAVAIAMLVSERNELKQKYDECVSASASKTAEPNEDKVAYQTEDVLPTTMTVGGRVYDILSFLRGNEKFVNGHIMVERAEEMGANLGKDDGEHLLKNQGDIPVELRGKVVFIFTNWRHPDDSEDVAYVYWGEDSQRWVQDWDWLVYDWDGFVRVLRRK
ncbi:MAG: hypothetical protein AAB963_02785 [Patescibacteria group bacterium]